MNSFAGWRLELSVVPFLVLYPISAVFGGIILANQGTFDISLIAAEAVLLVGFTLATGIEWLLVIWCRRLQQSGRLPDGSWAALFAYTAIGFVGITVILVCVNLFTAVIAPVAGVVLIGTANVLMVVGMGLVVTAVTDSLRDVRAARTILVDRLGQIIRANDLLAQAESRVRIESARSLSYDLLAKLREVLQVGPTLNDEELAQRVEEFIDGTLRPVSHHLHPVSVRLGLAQAVRSLNPSLQLTMTPALERLDADGQLLDDDVRLQVYRWVRDAVASDPDTHISLELHGRTLRVSLSPSTGARELDAVQMVAGLRAESEGAIVVPLRGQIPSPAQWAGQAMAEQFAVPRLRWRDALTVPLASRLPLVVVLSAGLVLMQFVFIHLEFTWSTLLAALASLCAAFGLTILFDRLPAPQRTSWGAARVVLEWTVVGVSSTLAFSLVVWMLEIEEFQRAVLIGDVVRGLYRFTFLGLAFVVAHGLAVCSREDLAVAEEALEAERQRQVAILEEAHRVDRDIAEALHRTVQARLAAVVVMLRLGRRHDAWTELVAISVNTLPRLIARVESAEVRPHLLVDDVPVGLTVIEDVQGASTMSPELLEDLRRAVSEVCVNAVRHGQADMVWIGVASSGPGYVVTCRDNGRGLRDISSPGLGARVLDDIAARWHGAWQMETAPQGGCVVTLTVRPESAFTQDHRHAISLT